jgi:hypothetical protein
VRFPELFGVGRVRRVAYLELRHLLAAFALDQIDRIANRLPPLLPFLYAVVDVCDSAADDGGLHPLGGLDRQLRHPH